MKDHTEYTRGFYWTKKAWYAEIAGNRDIVFGLYCNPHGGTTGEMKMYWIDLKGKETPRLECFNDAWSALSLFDDLILKLAEYDNQDITQEQFVDILLSCGFEDLTPYERL